MALSDPSNVRVGLARKQELLKRLAAQMAAKAAGGRAQGTGAQFRSATNLRTGGPARVALPFALPNGRARPAGFDPDTSENAWGAPQALAAVTPTGPPAGAGDSGSLPTSTQEGMNAGYPIQPDGSVLASDVTSPEPIPADSTFGNGRSLEGGGLPAPSTNPYFLLNPYDQSAALNTQAAPDPYTAMATAQMQRIMAGRNYAA